MEITLDAGDAASAEGMWASVEDAGQVCLRVVIEANCAARVAHRNHLNNFISPT